MKSFKELCAIIKRIGDNPEEKVDYLTVGDFMQLRDHVIRCGTCSDIVDVTVAKAPKDKEPYSEN